MRHFGKLLWLSPLALLGAIAGGAAAFCGGDDAKPSDKTAIKLPGAATRGVLSGDHFYTIISDQLTDVDLKQHKTRVIEPDYPTWYELKPFVDVADGKAVVASKDHLHILDLKSGDQLHSAKYDGKVQGLGFACGDCVFVVGEKGIDIVDMTAGHTVCNFPLRDADPTRFQGPLIVPAYQKVDKLLYVADSAAHSIKAIDLESGKVVAEMGDGYSWPSGLEVTGGKAFVRSINLSYGINNPQFGWFDLKTKKYGNLKHPQADFKDRIEEKDFDQVTLVAGPDASVCLAWKGMVYQFDGEGRQVGATPLDKDDDGRLVGVWNGQALTVGKDSLRLTPLAKATAKGD